MRWLNRPRKFICATEISSDLMWVVIGVSASNDIVMFESGDGICISSSENYSGPGKPHNMHSQDCRGARGSLEYSRGIMNRVTPVGISIGSKVTVLITKQELLIVLLSHIKRNRLLIVAKK